ncbi:hypothetical protein CDAR_280961 [Caerostris darwini]|uniref:Uncharacterized protein n=1 Tax=Caerostris darwini TaxID=1538125 RepID=A0AAV4VAX0_9ARAC|nr:hypothetical protein CDAR_280961 [Caerostris darwini]
MQFFCIGNLVFHLFPKIPLESAEESRDSETGVCYSGQGKKKTNQNLSVSNMQMRNLCRHSLVCVTAASGLAPFSRPRSAQHHVIATFRHAPRDPSGSGLLLFIPEWQQVTLPVILSD